jgi:hypothetical protein
MPNALSQNKYISIRKSFINFRDIVIDDAPQTALPAYIALPAGEAALAWFVICTAMPRLRFGTFLFNSYDFYVGALALMWKSYLSNISCCSSCLKDTTYTYTFLYIDLHEELCPSHK